MLKIFILALCVMMMFSFTACKQDGAIKGDEVSNQSVTTETSDVTSEDAESDVSSGIELEEDVFESDDTQSNESDKNATDTSSDKAADDNSSSDDVSGGSTSEETGSKDEVFDDNTSEDISSEEEKDDESDGTVKLPIDWF